MEKKFQIQIDESIILDLLMLANNFSCRSDMEDIQIQSVKVTCNGRLYEIEIQPKVNHTVITFLTTSEKRIALVYEDGYLSIEEIVE